MTPDAGLPCPAADTACLCGGTGTQQDPWQVCSASSFRSMILLGEQPTAYFLLTADVDLQGGVNQTKQFMATLDGSGHTVTGFKQLEMDPDPSGLFNWLSGTVTKLNVTRAQVSGGTAGILAAKMTGSAMVSQVTVDGFVSGGDTLGGMVGQLLGGNITDVKVTGNVLCASACFCGGVVGVLSGVVTLARVTAASTVDGATNVAATAGVVGKVTNAMLTLQEIHSSGMVTGAGAVSGVVATMDGSFCDARDFLVDSPAITFMDAGGNVATAAGVFAAAFGSSVTLVRALVVTAPAASMPGQAFAVEAPISVMVTQGFYVISPSGPPDGQALGLTDMEARTRGTYDASWLATTWSFPLGSYPALVNVPP